MALRNDPLNPQALDLVYCGEQLIGQIVGNVSEQVFWFHYPFSSKNGYEATAVCGRFRSNFCNEGVLLAAIHAATSFLLLGAAQASGMLAHVDRTANEDCVKPVQGEAGRQSAIVDHLGVMTGTTDEIAQVLGDLPGLALGRVVGDQDS